ncbi:MAG: hypothetical protein ACYDEV_05380 [Acidiferrobacter sp.]
MPQWRAEPTVGDIVWCHFLDGIRPRPKPRPAIILVLLNGEPGQIFVRVAYGTSRCATTLYRGEFAILQARNPATYKTAGLSYDTEFDLKQQIDLPYTADWFSVPPAAPYGQTPQLGLLHPSLMHAAEAAFRAHIA